MRKAAGAFLIGSAGIYFIYGSWLALCWSAVSSEKLLVFLFFMLPVLLVGAPVFALGRLLWSSWKPGKWVSRLGVLMLAGIVGSFLWPVRTPVIGKTNIRVVREDGTPFVGLSANQHWGMYGYYDKGGTDVGTTDATGTVSFPPRFAKGTIGLRLLRRLAIFALHEQDVSLGPISGAPISLPTGYWLPAEWSPAKTQEEADGSPHDFPIPTFNTPHGYFNIYNIGAKHPGAYVGFRRDGLMDDVIITLTLRPANSFEEDVIRQQAERERK